MTCAMQLTFLRGRDSVGSHDSGPRLAAAPEPAMPPAAATMVWYTVCGSVPGCAVHLSLPGHMPISTLHFHPIYISLPHLHILRALSSSQVILDSAAHARDWQVAGVGSRARVGVCVRGCAERSGCMEHSARVHGPAAVCAYCMCACCMFACFMCAWGVRVLS
jgi:hypothetical protein